ncbi:putative short-chain dehydrogenase [Pseudonocardia sp. Ae406_Ps2]|nr:putative short-chain dehydrogenase [Pseudonocardia sp. Ae406_Ps2]
MTGASRGLGAVYARELAERGYSVVLVARDAARLAEVAESVGRATGAIVETLPADLTDPAGLAAVERRITDRDLPVDVLVNNAGVETDAVFAEAPVEVLAGEIDLNVTALMRLTRAAVPAMTARGHGGVLNIASVAGYLPSGGGQRLRRVEVLGAGVQRHRRGVAARHRGDRDRGRRGPDPDRRRPAGPAVARPLRRRAPLARRPGPRPHAVRAGLGVPGAGRLPGGAAHRAAAGRTGRGPGPGAL